MLYTEPATPVAGEDLTIFYNPNNTNLGGREKIYLQVCALSVTIVLT